MMVHKCFLSWSPEQRWNFGWNRIFGLIWSFDQAFMGTSCTVLDHEHWLAQQSIWTSRTSVPMFERLACKCSNPNPFVLAPHLMLNPAIHRGSRKLKKVNVNLSITKSWCLLWRGAAAHESLMNFNRWWSMWKSCLRQKKSRQPWAERSRNSTESLSVLRFGILMVMCVYFEIKFLSCYFFRLLLCKRRSHPSPAHRLPFRPFPTC